MIRWRTQVTRTAASLILVLMCGPATVAAQIRYKDAEGVTHWVDSLEMVPEPYRAGAVGHPTRPPAAPTAEQEAAEALRLFQQKMIDWERAVTDCAEQVRSDRSNPDFARFAVVISGPAQLRMGGTEPAQAAFNQCMRDAGQPMSRVTPSTP